MSKAKYDKAYVDTKGHNAYWRDPNAADAKPTPAQNAAKKLKKNAKNKRKPDAKAMAIYEPWMEPGGWPDAEEKETKKGKETPEPKKPASPAPKPQARKPISKYRYFTEYSDAIQEDPEKKKEQPKKVEKPKTPTPKTPPPKTPTPPPKTPERSPTPPRERPKWAPNPRNKKPTKYDEMQTKEEKTPPDSPEPTPRKRTPTPQPRNKQRTPAEPIDRRDDPTPPDSPVRPILSRKGRPKTAASEAEQDDEDYMKWVMNGRGDDMQKSKKLLFENKKKKERK